MFAMKIFMFSLMFLFTSLSNAQTEEELWKKFVLDPTEDNTKHFIASFPTSTLLPQMADLIWGKCKADLDKKNCELYIRYFPTGEHIAEAGEIRSRASDVEIIVDGATDIAEDVINVFAEDENEPLPESEMSEEPENQIGLDQGETEPAIAQTKDRNTTQKQTSASPKAKPASKSTPKPAVKPAAKPVPKPEVKPKAQLYKVWSEHNYVINKRKGMLIHLNFKIEGLAGESCIAVIYFLDAAGQPIADINGKYKSKKGKVVSLRKFKPKANSTRYSDFRIFMPYDELHKKGKNKILYYAAIRNSKGVLEKTKPKSFNLTWK